MANKKPILLYQEGQQDQNHDVVQGADVIDASHLAVLPDGVHLNNAIEVVKQGNDNFLFVQGIVEASAVDTKFTRLRTVNGAISPHMTAPYTPRKDNNQYLVSPLPEPRSWASVKVQSEAVGGDASEYLVPIYHYRDFNKLEEHYAQISAHGFSTVTMATLGESTTTLIHEQDANGDTHKYTEGRRAVDVADSDFINVDVHLHLKNGEIRTHQGPVTIKDLGTLSRTAGHYARKVVLHAHDITGAPSVSPTPQEYRTATILWATDKRLKDKVSQGTPTLFVDTRNTMILRWGEDIALDTASKYVVIKF